MHPRQLFIPLLMSVVVTASAVLAQDKGTVDPKPLPPLAHPNDPKIGAKELFGRKVLPAAAEKPRVVGFYAHGCIAGAEGLPINGDNWQVMRLSRNRYWAHPDMVALVKRLAARANKEAGWPGILVGDMSQPRGGPMITGHASHQVGLDADIWLTPMPKRELTREEREEMSATMAVAPSRLDVDPAVWTPAHGALIRAAAEDPKVQRVFVNPAIKKALCREAGGEGEWLTKVRPYWGHDYHFHVRLACPSGNPDCKPQDPVPAEEGCGKDLDWWFRDAVIHPKPEPPPDPTKPAKPRRQTTMKDLPPACRAVLAAP
jgi:penicillin-insensitive murein endopeptidase